MDAIFDLFGDPVPANWGGRGRPAHVPTRENRNKVQLLLAFGWNNPRIANALSITEPTLRKHYFRELKVRAEARDRLDARLAMLLWGEAEAGNVAAMKEFRKLVERNDLMLGHASFYGEPAPKPAAKAEKPAKLGKKEEAAKLAESAGVDSDWGNDLLVAGPGGRVQ